MRVCECGKEKNILKNALLQGQAKTCGSKGCKGLYPTEILNARNLWINSGYKNDGLEFEHYYQLTQMNCFYCGNIPSNKICLVSNSKDKPFIYNGLDRIDSNKTHTINNIIPACWNCNRFKKNSSLQEFDMRLSFMYKNINNIVANNLSFRMM